MANSSKSHTQNKLLTERRHRLQKNLKRLSSAPFALVTMRDTHAADFSPRVEIESIVRVRKTFFYFHLWEDFRDVDTDPNLYGFKYALKPLPSADTEPLFRYECHPDIDDPQPDNSEEEADATQVSGSEYGRNPHFHPYGSLTPPISRLHYPFNRRERQLVVFSLIAWLEVDLVKRFYDSGRYKAEKISG